LDNRSHQTIRFELKLFAQLVLAES